ncbi:MAG TPA: ScpA family protein [Candidatus Paceibacterota bacterium]|nr:ScpA family protein [Candidatus Paceibacterota bacterium]
MKIDFEVKTEVFEGPLDLLLSLIEKRKLLINDVSLAKITDDYIAYLKNNDGMMIGERSDFILIASTLLLIKSKSLLPTIDLTEDEERSIEDLEIRLKIFKRLKEVEPIILQKYLQNPSFSKRQVINNQVVFSPSKQINISTIKIMISNILQSLPKAEQTIRAVIKKAISLEDMINRLTNRIKQSINMSFKDFSNFDKKDKINVIVSFLAMLELVKEGIIETEQNSYSDDIKIQTKKIDLPHYT